MYTYQHNTTVEVIFEKVCGKAKAVRQSSSRNSHKSVVGILNRESPISYSKSPLLTYQYQAEILISQ